MARRYTNQPAPSEAALPDGSPFREHAAAIGWLCMRWTMLESFIDELLLTLLEVEKGEVGDTLTSNTDFSKKIAIILAVGYKKRLDDEWYENIEKLLKTIDNKYRKERNRYVHDDWFLDLPAIAVVEMKKIEKRATLQRAQSRKPIELKTRHEKVVTPEEIWKFADTINLTAGHVGLAEQAYRIYKKRAQPKK